MHTSANRTPAPSPSGLDQHLSTLPVLSGWSCFWSVYLFVCVCVCVCVCLCVGVIGGVASYVEIYYGNPWAKHHALNTPDKVSGYLSFILLKKYFHQGKF